VVSSYADYRYLAASQLRRLLLLFTLSAGGHQDAIVRCVWERNGNAAFVSNFPRFFFLKIYQNTRQQVFRLGPTSAGQISIRTFANAATTLPEQGLLKYRSRASARAQ